MKLNIATLFASLIWGAVGFGFVIYGKRQREVVSLTGGLVLMGISYMISSALWMSVAACALIAGIVYLNRRE